MSEPMGSPPSKSRPSATRKGGRENTIGASQRDLVHLIQTFENSEPTKGGEVKRVHARWPFAQTSLTARLIHPGGSEIELTFACRNLSRTGIGLLHNTFVHPGSRIELTLPRPDGSRELVTGEVARCEHRQGVIHEIGVRFDEEIALPEFVRPDIFDGWLSFESVEPSAISGSVVHAESSKIDRKIVSHYLRDTDVSLRQVETGAEVLSSMSSGCDLIVAEKTLGDMSGAELAQRVRNTGRQTPVLIVGPSLQVPERSVMTASGVDGYLLKPFERDQFLLAVAEFLVAEARPNRSGTGGHHARLRSLADELAGFVLKNASIEAYVVCQQINAIAPELGYDAIAERAKWVSDKLAEGHKPTAIGKPVAELARACKDLRAAA